MSGPLLLTVILVALTVVCIVIAILAGGGYNSDAPVFWGFGALLIGLFAILFPLVFYLSIHFGRITCDTFGRQTERPTRYVFYTSWSTGDCLTQTADGKWIPTANLREFGEQP